MQIKVLVAYASRYGSTQEVAEAIAITLRENGLVVDLEPMREVKVLEGYTAVVMGAPLYMLHWHKDARGFLSRHREALRDRPVAIFALGPFHDEEEDWKEAREQLDEELAKFPWLTPIAIEIFGGKFDPAKLRFPDNLIAILPASPLRKMPASDIRDWTAIRAWANDLAMQLQPALPQ
ncbi:flavodoxin domain-containing protein [Methanosarcina sp. KYL-1]|uniref:flavodoxin domain-containing protein n=1 Tax=Methanosarcina sp. KYL-1 TaxID=2602068 RepID=UPI002100E815|nr:flavodoxin domain-containing protein [Methanosarcina sp. KYL-1]